MFIPFIAGISIAAAFALLGALMVKVSVLTLMLQGLAVVTVAIAVLAAWACHRRGMR